MEAKSGRRSSLQKSSCMQAFEICITVRGHVRLNAREGALLAARLLHMSLHLGQRHLALALAAPSPDVELVGAGGKVDQLRCTARRLEAGRHGHVHRQERAVRVCGDGVSSQPGCRCGQLGSAYRMLMSAKWLFVGHTLQTAGTREHTVQNRAAASVIYYACLCWYSACRGSACMGIVGRLAGGTYRSAQWLTSSAAVAHVR
jgi:hypothetical protein